MTIACLKRWLLNSLELKSSRNAEWIRVVAANLVLVHHMQPWAPDMFTNRLFQLIGDFGAIYSVSCFWVYSGFVFDSVYNGSHLTVSPPRLSFRSFMMRRVRRLYPLHISILCFIIVYSWIWPSQTDFNVGIWTRILANSMLVQNFLGGTSELSINPVTWSVSVELVSYVLFYCWVRYVRTLLSAVIPFLLMIVFIRLTGIANGPVTSTGMFFAGVLISYSVKAISKNQHWVFGMFVAAILSGVGFISNTFFSLRIIGFVAFSIIVCVRLKPSKLIQFFADRTYTIYLTHVLLIPLARLLISKLYVSDYIAAVLWWLLCWIVSFCVDLGLSKAISASVAMGRFVSFFERLVTSSSASKLS